MKKLNFGRQQRLVWTKQSKQSKLGWEIPDTLITVASLHKLFSHPKAKSVSHTNIILIGWELQGKQGDEERRDSSKHVHLSGHPTSSTFFTSLRASMKLQSHQAPRGMYCERARYILHKSKYTRVCTYVSLIYFTYCFHVHTKILESKSRGALGVMNQRKKKSARYDSSSKQQQ